MIKLVDLLWENYQLALKIYGDELTSEDVEFLGKLSNKDFTFKTLADLLIEDKKDHNKWDSKKWEMTLSQLRNYNKHVFPIKDFSFDSTKSVVTKRILEYRQKVMDVIREWPTIAKRNLRKDISLPRSDFYRLYDRVSYIDAHLSYLNNRDDTQKSMIMKKIFSSDHSTFEEVLDFVETKENLLQGKAFSKEELKKIIEKNDYDLKLIYERGDILIVDVTGQPGIRAIGCNSLWCFTYGSEYSKAGEQWETYSYNGHVYAIIDFGVEQTDPNFIHILIKPFDQQDEDKSNLFDMANQEVYGDAKNIITHITGDPDVLNLFKFEELW